jgi:hypothetical protein
MFRKRAAILAVTLACATGASIPSAVQAQLPAATAPSTNPATKLTFAPTLGGSQLIGSSIIGSPSNRAEMGYSYQYLTPQKMQIYVFVYDGGRRVPSGSDNPAVLRHFGSELDGAEQLVKSGGYTNFERQAVASTCSYGAVTFRCATYSAASPSGRLYSKLLLTGYHDNFVKIRIDWSQAAGHSLGDADRALEAFVTALMR